MDIITDDKLRGLDFREVITKCNKDGIDFKIIEFEIEYNYFLHNKQRIVLQRKEGGKNKFPQFDGYYNLSIRSGERRIEKTTVLLSNTNDLRALMDIVKGLKSS